MSALPEIDEVKAATREVEKLRQQVLAATNREARLEILAEAIRDERDAALAEVETLRASLALTDAGETEVHNITSVPEAG